MVRKGSTIEKSFTAAVLAAAALALTAGDAVAQPPAHARANGYYRRHGDRVVNRNGRYSSRSQYQPQLDWDQDGIPNTRDDDDDNDGIPDSRDSTPSVADRGVRGSRYDYDPYRPRYDSRSRYDPLPRYDPRDRYGDRYDDRYDTRGRYSDRYRSQRGSTLPGQYDWDLDGIPNTRDDDDDNDGILDVDDPAPSIHEADRSGGDPYVRRQSTGYRIPSTRYRVPSRDRDRDGVPDRRDRHPRNPRRD